MAWNKTIAAMAAVLVAGSGAAVLGQEQRPAGVTRTELQRHDLSAGGREAIQARIDFEPGSKFPRHKHPGEEVIYVLEGTLRYEVEGSSPVTLGPGDVLFVPAGTVHAAANVGTVKGSELATFIVEKGSPLVMLVE